MNPWFVLVLIPVLAAYLKLQRYYIPSCIELQRIESVTRSPIYASLGEAVVRIPTIRAYGRGAHFIAASDANVYLNGCTVQTQRMAAEWLNIRLRFLSAIVSTLAAVLVISGGVAPGLAGLTLVYAFSVPAFMERGTAQASDAPAPEKAERASVKCTARHPQRRVGCRWWQDGRPNALREQPSGFTVRAQRVWIAYQVDK